MTNFFGCDLINFAPHHHNTNSRSESSSEHITWCWLVVYMKSFKTGENEDAINFIIYFDNGRSQNIFLEFWIVILCSVYDTLDSIRRRRGRVKRTCWTFVKCNKCNLRLWLSYFTECVKKGTDCRNSLNLLNTYTANKRNPTHPI